MAGDSLKSKRPENKSLDKARVLEALATEPHATKRDLARKLGVKGSDRIVLKRILKELEDEGEIYEGIAFQFCKVATVALLAGRFVLPVASGLCAAFYVAAYVKGKRDTRCILKYPLWISAFWGVVCAASPCRRASRLLPAGCALSTKRRSSIR